MLISAVALDANLVHSEVTFTTDDVTSISTDETVVGTTGEGKEVLYPTCRVALCRPTAVGISSLLLLADYEAVLALMEEAATLTPRSVTPTPLPGK